MEIFDGNKSIILKFTVAAVDIIIIIVVIVKFSNHLPGFIKYCSSIYSSGWIIILIASALILLFYKYKSLYLSRWSFSTDIITAIVSVSASNMIFILSIIHLKIPMLNYRVLASIFTFQIILLIIRAFISLKTVEKLFQTKKLLVLGYGRDVDTVVRNLSVDYKYDLSSIHIYDIVDDTVRKYIGCSDEVLICSSLNNGLKEKAINICIEMNKPVIVIPKTFEISLAMSHVDYIDDMPVIRIDSLGLSPGNAAIKRIFDVIVAFVLFVAALPLMLCAACTVKLYDGGPALLKQERITKGGKVFTLYKFRTMIVDAEHITGPVLATENDHRITYIGRFLRRTRIDELPQLLNVIKGDMSIVGPRPERPHFGVKICEMLPEFKNRLAVKAGITGLAQVQGKYSTTPENKLRFDMLYIQNYSLWLDIVILFKTISVVLKKDCSKGVKEVQKYGTAYERYESNM